MNQLYRIGQIGIGVGVFRFHAVIQEVWSIESTVTRDRGSGASYSRVDSDHRDEFALGVAIAVDYTAGLFGSIDALPTADTFAAITKRLRSDKPVPEDQAPRPPMPVGQ